ncbi:MAG: hypothetical protein IPK82_20480 [Polyangiaceae bacterium]|nr:hypothetical protein [Polyangiaceae bacterium]
MTFLTGGWVERRNGSVQNALPRNTHLVHPVGYIHKPSSICDRTMWESVDLELTHSVSMRHIRGGMTQLKTAWCWMALHFVSKSSCVPTCTQSRLGRF